MNKYFAPSAQAANYSVAHYGEDTLLKGFRFLIQEDLYVIFFHR